MLVPSLVLRSACINAVAWHSRTSAWELAFVAPLVAFFRRLGTSTTATASATITSMHLPAWAYFVDSKPRRPYYELDWACSKLTDFPMLTAARRGWHSPPERTWAFTRLLTRTSIENEGRWWSWWLLRCRCGLHKPIPTTRGIAWSPVLDVPASLLLWLFLLLCVLSHSHDSYRQLDRVDDLKTFSVALMRVTLFTRRSFPPTGSSFGVPASLCPSGLTQCARRHYGMSAMSCTRSSIVAVICNVISDIAQQMSEQRLAFVQQRGLTQPTHVSTHCPACRVTGEIFQYDSLRYRFKR